MKYVMINTLLIVTISLSLPACSNDEEPSTDNRLSSLAHTWKSTTVTLGGDEMSGYENLELTFSGTAGSSVFGFGLTGRPETSPWPAHGVCSFSPNGESKIIRDPGSDHELQMTYVLNDNHLTIQFNYSGTGFNGRTSSVEGNWTFEFIRK